MESSVVIGRVCERLRCDFPSVPILTCHDSILCPGRYVELVQRILVDSFWDYPMPPATKIKEPAEASSIVPAMVAIEENSSIGCRQRAKKRKKAVASPTPVKSGPPRQRAIASYSLVDEDMPTEDYSPEFWGDE